MCLPKITPRAKRVIRTEQDPYKFERKDTSRIYREVYEDGTKTLFATPFADSVPVRSIRCDYSNSLRRPDVVLGFADGCTTIRLTWVSSRERTWLLESMEDAL